MISIIYNRQNPRPYISALPSFASIRLFAICPAFPVRVGAGLYRSFYRCSVSVRALQQSNTYSNVNEAVASGDVDLRRRMMQERPTAAGGKLSQGTRRHGATRIGRRGRPLAFPPLSTPGRSLGQPRIRHTARQGSDGVYLIATGTCTVQGRTHGMHDLFDMNYTTDGRTDGRAQ